MQESRGLRRSACRDRGGEGYGLGIATQGGLGMGAWAATAAAHDGARMELSASKCRGAGRDGALSRHRAEVVTAKREQTGDEIPVLDPAQQFSPLIRTNFADTAFWAAALVTAPDGTAQVDFSLPDSLTTWKVKSWTLGPGTKVGQAESEIVTSKDLLVRLQAPRFFVEKDEVVLSANVHNKLKTAKSVQVVLELEGSVLQPLGESSRTVQIDAGSEQRVDYRVKVVHEGQAVIRMKALTDEESDAAQMSFPAYVHGMLKMEAFAGSIRPDEQKAQVVVRVPSERKPDQSRLEVRYSPTLAGALVDALPYLADYPYGCTEQTLNRFLPTVITQKILIKLGARSESHSREAHEPERPAAWRRARSSRSSRKGYEHNPVFDQAEVARMAAAGIQRLADMQLSDGGWGWFSGFGEYAVAAHDGAGRPRAANRPPERRRACPKACSKKASPGSRATRTSRPSFSKTRPARSSRTRRSADDRRRPGLHGPVRCGRSQRPDDRLPRSRSHPSLGLRQDHARAWAWNGSAKRPSWRPSFRTSVSMSSATMKTRRPILSSPTRDTGGGGTAARSKPTHST